MSWENTKVGVSEMTYYAGISHKPTGDGATQDGGVALHRRDNVLTVGVHVTNAYRIHVTGEDIRLHPVQKGHGFDLWSGLIPTCGGAHVWSLDSASPVGHRAASTIAYY